jgi:hypothetical protein
MPKKYLRVRDRSIRAEGIRHAMEAKRHLVQVALEFKAGGVDEGLILRVVRHLGAVEVVAARSGRRLK